VLARAHVRARLDGLLREYAGGFQVDADLFEGKLAAIDPGDPASFQAALGDPESLLGAIQTPAQQEVLTRLAALVAPIEGYVDHVMDLVGEQLIGSYAQLTEALRRRRIEAGPADSFVERLLGLQLDRHQFERGAAFVDGVVERAGEDGLRRLWQSERDLPTPAEVDAPGLWLARIELPD
jgi:putative hydrolase